MTPPLIDRHAAGPTEQDTADTERRRGVIELICGCMFSGKTTELLRLLRNEQAEAIAIFKHSLDDRYSRTEIMTHNGDGCHAISVAGAQQITLGVADAVEVVAIDEGHFFDHRLVEVCAALASAGKRVIVTALDRDMWGHPFDTIERLKECAGVVRIKEARCTRCGKPATHTYRKTPIRDRHLVGGPDDFEPRCRNCWSPPPEDRIVEMA